MAVRVTPIPTPFLLNTIKLLDPTVEDLMTDKTTLNCPNCGESQQLYVRPLRSPRYFLCLHCHRAYDSVLLHHTMTTSNSLKDSLDVILQHKGLLGKANKKTSIEILKQSKALIGYNALVANTHKNLETNSWLKLFMKALKCHLIYPGSKQSDIDALRKTTLLWAKKDFGEKKNHGVEDKHPLYKRNRAWKYNNTFLVIPSWCPIGVAGYWFLGEMRDDDITYYATIGPSQKGGIAYLHETEKYEKVIASNNPGAVLYTQTRHYARFKRYAPIVLYNAWTTPKDWDQLGSREVIFLDITPLNDPSADCTQYSTETLQQALNVRGSGFSGVRAASLLTDQGFGLLNKALTENKSTYECFKLLARQREDRLVTLKTLDYNRFLRYVSDTHEQRTTELFKVFGGHVEIWPTVAMRDEIIEETSKGYRYYGRPYMLSNFTVRLRTAYLRRRLNEVYYEMDIFVEGKLYDTRIIPSASMYGNHWVHSLRHDILMGNGERLLTVQEGISDDLAAVVLAFSSTNFKKIPVCEDFISYDEPTDLFLLAGARIRGQDGALIPTRLIPTEMQRSPAFPWSARRIEPREFAAAKRNMCPLVLEVVAYLALMFVALRNKEIKIRPLLLERYQNAIEDLNRAIPTWPAFIKHRVIRTFGKDRQDEFDGVASVLEVRGCEKFCADGYGYALDGQFPLIKPRRNKYAASERVASYYFRKCVCFILQEGYTTLHEISKRQYEFISSKTKTCGGQFMPQKNAVLTERQCRGRTK